LGSYLIPVSLPEQVANVRLTSPDNEQDVRHIELDLGDSGISYAPGDVINVMPENSGDVIRRFCERCWLDPEAEVLIEPRVPGAGPEAVPENRPRDGASTSDNAEQLEVNPEDDLKSGPGTCSNPEEMVKQGLNPGAGNGATLVNRAVAWAISQGDGLAGMPSATRSNGSNEGPGSNGMNGVSGSTGRGEVGAEGDSESGQSEVANQASASGADGGEGRFGPVRIGTLVRAALDVASASPRRYFFEVLFFLFKFSERSFEFCAQLSAPLSWVFLGLPISGGRFFFDPISCLCFNGTSKGKLKMDGKCK
jgi:hypothetical protein